MTECTREDKIYVMPHKKSYINPSVQTILAEIRQEYCLKRNNFNPKGPSPNIFVSKLRWRMKTYYKDLYNSFNEETK